MMSTSTSTIFCQEGQEKVFELELDEPLWLPVFPHVATAIAMIACDVKFMPISLVRQLYI